jgi:hypothetical protein
MRSQVVGNHTIAAGKARDITICISTRLNLHRHMPHLRLNAKTDSPNPYFNFTSALPSFLNAPGLPNQQNAKGLLDALAAQVRPVCKKHGFNVNSFEEVSPFRHDVCVHSLITTELKL